MDLGNLFLMIIHTTKDIGKMASNQDQEQFLRTTGMS